MHKTVNAPFILMKPRNDKVKIRLRIYQISYRVSNEVGQLQ